MNQIILRSKQLPDPATLFETFLNLGLAKDQYDFSSKWLGQAKNYLSVIKARDGRLSPSVLLRLKFRLEAVTDGYAKIAKSHSVPSSVLVGYQTQLALLLSWPLKTVPK